ncbi:hypothetical protein H5410_056374, partial [Solanum commersonii]
TNSSVNITEVSPLPPQSPIDLNNSTPSYQPGPYITMLSNHLFEGDLPKSKSFESNILAASESMVIESLAQLREGVRNKEGSSFIYDLFGDSEPVFDQTPEGPGTKRNKGDKEVSKYTIVDNLRLQKYLGGRVFDPEIITKPGMDSLVDLVEIQSWNHLFMTKSPILHEEKVCEFYYNVNFVDDGSLNTLMGNKSLHLEIPREGTKFMVGKYCTKKFTKEYSKLPDMHHADIQKKLMKGENQLLFEFVNKVLLP